MNKVSQAVSLCKVCILEATRTSADVGVSLVVQVPFKNGAGSLWGMQTLNWDICVCYKLKCVHEAAEFYTRWTFNSVKVDHPGSFIRCRSHQCTMVPLASSLKALLMTGWDQQQQAGELEEVIIGCWCYFSTFFHFHKSPSGTTTPTAAGRSGGCS